MSGRDPHQSHRVATPLELLFDLTFVIAYGTAASELAHFVAAGHVGPGIGGFAFASFGIAWAWINFSWFASAYDTDDWVYRLTTMVQMVGVLIFSLGLPAMFESFDHGIVDNRVMVLGYVVMRVPMIAQWARAARQDPAHRNISRHRIASIIVSQVGWCLLLLVRTQIAIMFTLATIPLAIELFAPVLADRKYGGPPWHPHHIAERYSLVVIIALGEGIVGTMATLAAIVGPHGPGWSLDVAVLGFAGTALTFGMWWIYFLIPSGELLVTHRERAIGWGYGHILVFGAAVAVGAGLHIAAFAIEGHCVLSLPMTVLCTAIPVALYLVMIFVVYFALARELERADVWTLAASAVPIIAAVVMACAGAGLVWCIAMVALTPWVSVIVYELAGGREADELTARP
jgi:low temperature requirement protein LtrA